MPAKGHHQSEEAKAKIRAAHLGRPKSEQHRANLRGKTGPKPGSHHSDETIEKIRASNLGQKRSAEAVERNRQSHIGLPSSRKGAVLSDETKDKIRQARAQQIHPQFVKRGITQQMIDDAKASGLRWCAGKCKAFLPADKFYSAAESLKQCIECGQRANRNFAANRTPEEKRELAKYASEFRLNNPEQVRDAWLRSKYGVGPEWYGDKLAEQDGHCALCDALVDGRKLSKRALITEPSKYLVVDHDHETGLVRGLLCAKCNTALARVEYIKEWATRALAYLARYGSDRNYGIARIHSDPDVVKVECG